MKSQKKMIRKINVRNGWPCSVYFVYLFHVCGRGDENPKDKKKDNSKKHFGAKE